ncbi:MAG: hypothetical protein ACREX6_06980 [Casimicrobiaceae bacterium]
MSAPFPTHLSAAVHRTVRAFTVAVAITVAITLSGIGLARAQAIAATSSHDAPDATPAAAGPATPAPSAATGSAAVPESRACRKAKSRVTREERSIGKVQHSIDHARAGSTTCSTKPVCDRYATKITELEARRAHHDSKLTQLRKVADSACAAT